VHRFQRRLRNAVILVLIALVHLHAGAQEQKAPVAITPSARLAAAKSAFLAGKGSNIPYDVVESSLEGWGRFALVETPAQADIIVEVSSLAPGGAISSGPAASPRSRIGPAAGGPPPPAISQIRLAVYDAKTRILLWSAVESLKSAWHKKTYEDNLMEASARLVSRLREQLEPPPAK
jgi:hypothetical protein